MMESFNSEPNASLQPEQPRSRKGLIIASVAVVVVALLVAALAAAIYGKQQDTMKQKTSSAQVVESEQLEPAMVSITEGGFVPQTVRIKKGQTVIWTNTDSNPHQVATDPYPQEDGLAGFVADAPAQKDDSYSFTFSETGTFTYHDKLNYDKLRGSVVVE